MRKEARILYIYDPEIDSSRLFAEHLGSALPGWDITIASAKLTTLLFETRKYNLVHLFMPVATARASQFVRKLAGKTKIVQTALAFPERLEDYKNHFSVDKLIVFCEQDRERVRKIQPDLQVEVIPPTVNLPDVNHLQHSGEIRKKLDVGERLFTVALNDLSNKQQFDSFLYVIREFNRRGEFRLIVPRFNFDSETQKRRKEMQKQIDNERLHSTTLLQEDFDLHSLLDSADFAIHLRKDRDDHFDFPLSMVEASLIGKPVLCYDIPPYNEFISGFRKKWASSTIEEIVREARDLHRAASNLEQISTELARYSRTIFSPDRVATLYRTVYESALNSQDARAS